MFVWKRFIFISLFLVLTPWYVQAEFHETEEYWQCLDPSGGEWALGRAPSVCLIDPFGDVDWVSNSVASLIYHDDLDPVFERNRYVEDLVLTLRDSAAYYLILRKPDAVPAELSAWQRAIYTLTHQESFMSHYRKTVDGKVKMMRGDSGHGHGLMQIDDRWHFVAVESGAGWQIFENILYAMELYYTYWQSAASAACVETDDMWEKRARSAYSAYNGGAMNLCRWMDTENTWARNDAGFYEKWQSQTWLTYVSDMNAAASLDTTCFIEEEGNCSTYRGGDDDLWGAFVMLPSGESCVLLESTLHCVGNRRDESCLLGVTGVDIGGRRVSINSSISYKYEKLFYDRHVCLSSLSGVYPVGSVIHVQKAINLRDQPGGNLVSTVVAFDHYQILDVEVQSAPELKRYYRISYQGEKGYIYAGNHQSYLTWGLPGDREEADLTIAAEGDWVSIQKNAINVREGAATSFPIVATAPLAMDIEVLGVSIVGDSNNVYYDVYYDQSFGVMYSGQLLPMSDVRDWTRMEQSPKNAVDRLSSGQRLQRLTASLGESLYFYIDAPSNTKLLSIEISGGQGDADLYVKKGQVPTLEEWDYRPYLGGSNELVVVDTVGEGRYYVMLHAYSTFSGIAILGSVSDEVLLHVQSAQKVIPDANTAGVESTLEITKSGPSGRIHLNVDIVHTYRGDVYLQLIAPNGQSWLIKDVDSTDGGMNVHFQGDIDAGDISASGVWKLKVADYYAEDTGYLQQWSLRFE